MKKLILSLHLLLSLVLASCNSASEADEGASTNDSDSPGVSGVTAETTKTFKLGETIELKVDFTENVELVEEAEWPKIKVRIGEKEDYLTYGSGSGTEEFVFSYTVQSGDLDADGIEIIEQDIIFDEDVAKDSEGNELNKSLEINPIPYTFSSIKVDAVAPTLTEVELSSNYSISSIQAAIGTTITLSFTASEALSTSSYPSVSIMGTSVTPSPVGSEDKSFQATYQMQASDPNGDVYFSIQFEDTAGNQGSLVSSPTDATNVITFNSSNILVDTTSPSIVKVENVVDGIFGIGDTIQFDLSADEEVFVDNSANPRIQLNIGGSSRFANFANLGSGSNNLKFSYTVQENDFDDDGISLLSTSLVINSNQVEDSSGNDIVTTINSNDVSGVRIDAIRPTLTSVNITSTSTGDAGHNDQVTLTFTASEELESTPNVTIDGVPVNVFDGTSDNEYFSIYTIPAGTAHTIAFNISGIKDVVGNDSAASVSSTTDGSSVFYNGLISTGDNTPPTILAFNTPSAGTHTSGSETGRYKVGEAVTFEMVFSEEVTVTNSTGLGFNLDLDSTTDSRSTTYQSGSGSNTLSFTYTVQAGDQDLTGVTLSSALLNMAAGGIEDDAGNLLTDLTLPSANFTTVLVDDQAPTFSSIRLISSNVDVDSDTIPEAGVNDVVTLTFVANETLGTLPTVFIAGSQRIPNEIADNVYQATKNMVSSDPTGDISFSIVAEDVAGNTTSSITTTTDGSAVEFDDELVGVDETEPRILAVVPPGSGTFSNGASLTFQVVFDDDMVVSGGTPSISLALDSGTVTAEYDSSSTGNNLNFIYTVQTGDSEVNTIQYDGGFSIDVNGATIEDDAGNSAILNFSAANPTGVQVDAVAPELDQVTIVSNVTGYTQFATDGSEVTLSLQSNETIATPTVTIGGQSVTVTGSGTIYTAKLTVSGTISEGLLPFTIDFEDINGNEGTQVTSVINSSTFVNVDRTEPKVISITRNNSSPTKNTTFSFNVEFDEEIRSLDESPFELFTSGTTASISGVSGSITTYTVSITGVDGDGTVSLILNGALGTVQDRAGNAITATFDGDNPDIVTYEQYEVDNTAPFITVSSPSISKTRNSPVTYIVQIESNDTIANIIDANIIVTGSATATPTVTGDNLTWQIKFDSISGSGNVDFTIEFGGTVGTGIVKDGLGNNSSNVSGITGFTVDNDAPSISSISKVSSSPSNQDELSFSVIFDEAIDSTPDISDFALDIDGFPTLTANIQSVTKNSDTNYTVIVENVTGDGSLGLNLDDSNSSIQDEVGNTLSLTSFTGETYIVDNTPPSVSVSSPSATNVSSGPIDYIVTYSDIIYGSADGFDKVLLDPFDITIVASPDTISANKFVESQSTAQSKVTFNNFSGNDNAAVGFEIAAGSAVDLAGNTAEAVSSIATFNIDVANPGLTSIKRVSGVTENTSSDTVSFEVTFSEVVKDVTTGAFEIKTVSGNVTGSFFSLSPGTDTDVYTIAINNVTGTGELRLDLLDGSSIKDGSDSALTVTQFTGGESYQVDRDAPAAVTNIQLSNSHFNTQVSPLISWTNPASDFSYAEIKIESVSDFDDNLDYTRVVSDDSFIHDFGGSATLEECVAYIPTVRVYDEIGNISAEASHSTGMIFDTSDPTPVTTFETNDIGSTFITPRFSWSGATDCSISHYEIAIRSELSATNDILDWTKIPGGSSTLSYAIEDGSTDADGAVINIDLTTLTNYKAAIRVVDQVNHVSTEVETGIWQVGEPFEPTDITGDPILFWLDAQDSSHLFQSTACGTAVSLEDDPIGCITDKSPTRNNDFNAQSGSNRPIYKTSQINGYPAIEFSDGQGFDTPDDGEINLLDVGNRTHFIVFKTGTDINNQQMLYKEGGGTNGIAFFVESTKLYVGIWRDNSDIATERSWIDFDIAADTEYIVSYVLNNGINSFIVTLNGEEKSNTSIQVPSHSGDIEIGNSAAFKDEVGNSDTVSNVVPHQGEQIMFNYTLSEDDRQKIEGYLACKWDLRDRLVVSHPYYNANSSANGGCPVQ